MIQLLHTARASLSWTIMSILITLLTHWGIQRFTGPHNKIFFVHIPKTGGTAFSSWLDQQHQKKTAWIFVLPIHTMLIAYWQAVWAINH